MHDLPDDPFASLDRPATPGSHPAAATRKGPVKPEGRAAPTNGDPEHDPILVGLTPPQRAAVLHTEGPLLVLAAAGSGKTRVITRRIAHLVRMGVPPWSILAVTFTNKAAGEMRERVTTQLLGHGADAEQARHDRRTRGLTVTTFHALCARLLRRYAQDAQIPGLRPDYSIYDTGDQTALMKRVLEELQLKTSNWPPRTVLSAISNAKNELLDAEAFERRASDYYTKSLAKIYTKYQAALRQAGAVDFDDLLLLTAWMLRHREGIRAECQHRWQYLLIDEYQDTNRAQFEIASLLAGDGPTTEAGAKPGPNICVVGDPDQSIYGWRGADITNILEFEEHYPSAKTVLLGENFRSTEPILAVADKLIKQNRRRKDKPLFTSKPGGDRVCVVLCRDERHEAELIADWFGSLHEPAEGRPGLPWKDMAVFYRTNALSRVMEDALRQAQIPYVIARGTAFFDREEIKHAVAYLRVVANQADDVSLTRIVNTPARGISKATVDTLRAHGSARGTPLFGAMRDARGAGLADRAVASVDRFLAMIDAWTGAGTFLGQTVSGTLHELVERVIKESGLEAHYQKQAAAGDEGELERLDNLGELISSARAFEDEYDPASDPVAFPGVEAAQAGTQAQVPPLLAVLRGWLESIALVADADAVDPAQGAVTMMTLHAAKGLEFPAVAMIGLEEGLLPHSRAFESENDLEEERRLAFVGITRAMQRLHITSAKYRTVRGMTERSIPSRFLDELDREHTTISDQSDRWMDDDGDGFDDARGAAVFGTGRGDPGSRPGSGMRSGSMGDRLEEVRAARREIASAGDRARSEYPPGCTVRHPQFGEGIVVKVTGGQNARAEVKFRSVGVKTLVLEYARLKRTDA